MVTCNLETSHVPYLIDDVEVVVELPPVGVFVKPWHFTDGILVLTRMIAFKPYAKANEISPLGVYVMVR